METYKFNLFKDFNIQTTQYSIIKYCLKFPVFSLFLNIESFYNKAYQYIFIKMLNGIFLHFRGLFAATVG